MIVQQQRHFFLNEALTLVGVHQRLMTFTLLKLQNLTRKEDVVMAVDVMALLYQLSKFQQTWRLQHWNSMQGVLQAAAAAVYFSIAHLIRPTWLANITKNTLLGTFSKIVPEVNSSLQIHLTEILLPTTFYDWFREGIQSAKPTTLLLPRHQLSSSCRIICWNSFPKASPCSTVTVHHSQLFLLKTGKI